MNKWECPHCGLKVRLGIKDDPKLVHDTCSIIKDEKVLLVQHDEIRHTIYEGDDGEDKPEEVAPPIINEIDKQLREGLPDDGEIPTIEGIASKFGIHKNYLYKWVKSDPDFSEALEALQEVQKDDPF